MTEPTVPSQGPGRRGLRRTAARAGAVAFAALRVVRWARGLARAVLEILLAVIIVFEEWGWKPLAALLGRLARFRSIAALEAAIEGLPPYPSLLVFALPSLLVLPLKLLSLWLIAGGHVVLAGLLFAGAKVVGTALLARIFQLTQPRLMQLAWFAAIYNTVVPWKDALIARAKATPVWRAAAALKASLKERLGPVWQRLRPRAEAALARLRLMLGRG